MMKTTHQLNLIIIRRKGFEEDSMSQSFLIVEPEDREVAHHLLDEMMDRMRCPK